MIKHFDVCFIGCQNVSLYRFGIAPNKIPEYMFSAKPILQSCSDGYDYITHANCGLSVESGKPQAIVEAVLKLKDMSSEERVLLGKNGRDYALQKHDYAKLAEKLARVLSE